MATLDELQQQLAALSARVDALTTPPDDYYTSKYSGEEIDAGIKKTESLPESWPLPIASGGTGADTAQLALVNLGGAPARNFADNAYFSGGGDPGNFPINQKGLKTYSISASGTKMVDRWLLNSGTVVIESDCIDLQGLGIIIQRYAEFDIRQGEYTFSWLDTDGNMYSTLVTGTYTIAGALKVTHDNTNQLYVSFDQPSTKVVAIGLDAGTEQRQFYQGADGKWRPIELPNYWETLAQCQRYFYRVNVEIYARVGYGVQTSPGAQFILTVPLPQIMRANPVVTTNGTFEVEATSGSVPLKSLVTFAAPTGIESNLLGTVDTTVSGAFRARALSKNAYIDFSAEL